MEKAHAIACIQYDRAKRLADGPIRQNNVTIQNVREVLKRVGHHKTEIKSSTYLHRHYFGRNTRGI